jgi:ribosomal protein S18 acetylase RimI-like enzyme
MDDDPIVMHVLGKKRPFVYLDQIGVSEEHRGPGISDSMMGLLLGDVSDEGYDVVWGAISHEPIRNRPAICFSRKSGFCCIEEVPAYDGLLFGIYSRRLPVIPGSRSGSRRTA